MHEDLNPEQRKAVQTLSGPLLVLAGAGSGKTRVVTIRIAELIQRGVTPSRILAVTFTKKAAVEMQERVSALLGTRLQDRPVVSTFHAHCVRILRRHIRRLGYPERFAIYDRGDQESIARSVLREIKVPGSLLRPGDLLFLISRWKTMCLRPDAAASLAQTDKEHLAAMAYRRYQNTLKVAGAVDFDDLLLLTEQLLETDAEVRRDEAARFDHLLIDEYQDTNGSQYRIVRALARDHQNLCVVGDDDQSIYGWRGAEVQHILRFAEDWPETTVVRLEHNYRSTAAILERANQLISYNKMRYDKVLRPARPGGENPKIEQFANETAEAKSVVSEIKRFLDSREWEPNDFAILFRTNEQPRAFETELRRLKLPYVLIGGMSFFDRKEVRDVFAYLKLLASPQDEVSLLRIINRPPRGIPQGVVQRLTDKAVSNSTTVWNVMTQRENLGMLPGPKQAAIETFVALINRARADLKTKSIVEVVRTLISNIQYQSEIDRQYDDPNERESRWNVVEEVVNAIGVYEKESRKPTVSGFLDEILLSQRDFSDEKENQLKRNGIVLMTLHSAKGLEFPHVYMVGMEEGLLPHHRSIKATDDAIDEERRLCYVGVTRAEERLTLTMALTRMKWGKPRETSPSRFLFEMIGQADKATDTRKSPGPPRRQKQSAPRRHKR
ncbi:MAG: UvrD-helicase domain-containing protein [Pirellulaceae bacterium]|nr:UvrD-helicase domain-containing protein [Pirellulaceae bacterium]